MSTPPLPLRLLSRLLPGPLGAEACAELAAGFEERRARSGAIRAHLWLWRQVAHPDTVRLSRALRRGRGALAGPPRPVTDLPRQLAWQLRTAGRSLARRPTLTASIVTTLALGIGANTAVFSVIDGVLLEPLPFPGGDRLVFVWGETRDDDTELLSGPQAAEVVELDSFEDAAMVFGYGATSLVRDGLPEPVRTLTVGHRFFDLLGVEPLLGRTFVAEDEFKLSNEQIRDPGFVRPISAIVLRHDFWRDRFGADPTVLGRVVEISGHRHEIVGVMPPGFRSQLPAELGESTVEDLWMMSPFDQPSFPRDTRFVGVMGRIRAGASLDDVQRDLDGLATWQRATFVEDARDEFRMRAAWLRKEAGATAREPLTLLLAAVAAVLLIACANVATLLLVRATERDGELRVRRALGASRAQLAALGLSESLLAATAGGALGVLLAPVLVELLVSLAPREIPRLDAVGVDGSVLGFTAALTTGVALLAGALPALRSARVGGVGSGARLAGSLRERYTGAALVIGEVALAVALVTCTGLLLRSLSNTLTVDPGFQTAGVYTWEANLTTPTHPTWASRVAYLRGVQESLERAPRIRRVGVVTPVPMDGADRAEVRLGMDEGARRIVADFRRTGPGGLETLGIGIVRGRALEWADLEDFDRLYAVVDERFAREAWPDESALGQVISMVRREYGDGSRVWDEWKRIEVVGVAETIHGRDLRMDDPPTVYVTYSQNMWGRPAFVAASDDLLTTRFVREAAADADPRPLLTDVTELERIAGSRLAPLRFALTLVGGFAALGMMLAVTGVYGLLSYSVGRRERELDIRSALGAGRLRLGASVIRSGVAMTGVGLLVGWVLAGWTTRLVESLLFEVPRSDPATHLAVGGALLGAALLASWLPARRAWRRDPVRALR